MNDKQPCHCVFIGPNLAPDADCPDCNGSGYIDALMKVPSMKETDPYYLGMPLINGSIAVNADRQYRIYSGEQAPTSITAHMITGTLHATSMTFGNVVSIDLATGAITRLPGFTTTDAAALAFWEAVERLAPRR